MKTTLCCASALLGALLVATVSGNLAGAADGQQRAQSTIKSAQSYGCVLECRDKGWSEDQCKAHCRWKEGG